MKETFPKWLFPIVVLSLILSACGANPSSTPSPAVEQPTEPPVPTEPSVTEAPVALESPTEIVPINLGGPVMEVGATYRYVDGSTLVAIPGGEFIMGYGSEDNLEHKVT